MVRNPDAYRKMILDLAGESDIVKVSDEDLAYLFPGLGSEEAEKKMAGICRSNLIVYSSMSTYPNQTDQRLKQIHLHEL